MLWLAIVSFVRSFVATTCSEYFFSFSLTHSLACLASYRLGVEMIDDCFDALQSDKYNGNWLDAVVVGVSNVNETVNMHIC